MRASVLLLLVAGCTGAAANDGGTAGDGPLPDASAADLAAAPDGGGQPDLAGDGGAAPRATGMVTGEMAATCPMGAPQGSTCETLIVSGCPEIESQPLSATVSILMPQGAPIGTVVSFSGGDGTGLNATSSAAYATAGYRALAVAWAAPGWEDTTGSGIKAAACRPATVLRWAFSSPSLHNGSRTTAFCAQGSSAGSSQVAYALAHYGLSDVVDYANLINATPFARLDSGCDGTTGSQMVCGVDASYILPPAVRTWENTPTCATANPPQADIDKWRADGIVSAGADFVYPQTKLQLFVCDYQPTAVLGNGKFLYDAVVAANADPGTIQYNCYGQADGCDHETFGQSTVTAYEKALTDNCTPRH